METRAAVRDALDEQINARLSRIESTLSRLTWIMVSGIGAAFIAFVVGGGLAHVPAVLGAG